MRLIDADVLNGYKFGLISPYAQNLFHKIINEAPTIVQEQRIGHWYKKPHEICYTCDQCRTTNASGVKYNFCPHCGAKMEVQDEGDG